MFQTCWHFIHFLFKLKLKVKNVSWQLELGFYLTHCFTHETIQKSVSTFNPIASIKSKFMVWIIMYINVNFVLLWIHILTHESHKTQHEYIHFLFKWKLKVKNNSWQLELGFYLTHFFMHQTIQKSVSTFNPTASIKSMFMVWIMMYMNVNFVLPRILTFTHESQKTQHEYTYDKVVLLTLLTQKRWRTMLE